MTSSSRRTAKAPAYTLKFVPAALAEWRALDGSVKAPLKNEAYQAAVDRLRDLLSAARSPR